MKISNSLFRIKNTNQTIAQKILKLKTIYAKKVNLLGSRMMLIVNVFQLIIH